MLNNDLGVSTECYLRGECLYAIFELLEILIHFQRSE